MKPPRRFPALKSGSYEVLINGLRLNESHWAPDSVCWALVRYGLAELGDSRVFFITDAGRRALRVSSIE